MRASACDMRTDRLMMCGLFVVFIALGVLRSWGWSLTSELGDGNSSWLAAVGFALLLAMCALFTWAVQTPNRAAYLLGGSAALGVFPSIPKLPFLPDVTHTALILFFIANRRCWSAWKEIPKFIDIRIKSYTVFLFIAVVSVAINFAIRGDVWQLKVGLSGLFLLVTLLLTLCVMAVSQATGIFNQLRDGFLDSAQILAAVGCIALILLLVTPYSTGFAGDGQDTIFGLGYFDRLKLMFDGPGIAGSFFVLAMSFAVHALSARSSKVKGLSRMGLVFLIQAAPWLVAASGSRVAKVALLILILTGLAWQPVRRTTLSALPSTLASLFVGLDFQSFPDAVRFALGHVFPGSFDVHELGKMRLGERFLKPEQRWDLMVGAVNSYRESPWLNQFIGMGLGVAGYSNAPYPSPHNQYMKLLFDVGFLGFTSYLVFWFKLNSRVFTLACINERPRSNAAWMFGVSMISIIGLSVAYQVETRGLVLVLLLMMFTWPGISIDKSN